VRGEVIQTEELARRLAEAVAVGMERYDQVEVLEDLVDHLRERNRILLTRIRCLEAEVESLRGDVSLEIDYDPCAPGEPSDWSPRPPP
jgi:hypothetical protein